MAVGTEASTTADYRNYPLNFNNSGLNVEDLHLYYKKLEGKSVNLFLRPPADCQVELWQPEGTKGRRGVNDSDARCQNSTLVLNSLEALKTHWKNKLGEEKDTVIFINRKNSWSRMKLSYQMFNYICSSINIHPRFLDFVFDFGHKSSPPDDSFINLYRFISPLSDCSSKPLSFEICYNIRHFELHGRQSADPWTCRQSAIYQKFSSSTCTSTFIIIHQPLALRESLQNARPGSFSHPMAIHIRYIRSTTHNWKDFLRDMGSDLTQFDGILSVTKPFKEFQNDWGTVQKVHYIRKRLYLSISIMDGILEVLTSLKVHAESLSAMIESPQHVLESVCVELEQIGTEIKNHKSAAQSLLNFSDDLRLMSRVVMAFCNQEMVINNGLALEQLGQSGAIDNQNLTQLTEKTQKDSRTMRIATIIAMVYLPANLVISFFSTGLVTFQSAEEASVPPSSVHMRVHPQIWIAIFISLILAVSTMAAVTLVDRFGKKQRLSKLIHWLHTCIS